MDCVRMFPQNIRMSFGLDKSAVLEVMRGRQDHSSRTELLDGSSMNEGEDTGYKHLDILRLHQTLRLAPRRKQRSGKSTSDG